MAIRQNTSVGGLKATVSMEFDTRMFRDRLMAVSQSVRRRGVVKAVRYAMGPVRSAAKREASRISRTSPTNEGTGAMSRSLKVDAKLTKKDKDKAVGLVGPRRGYSEVHRRKVKHGLSETVNRHGTRHQKKVRNRTTVKRKTKRRKSIGLRAGSGRGFLPGRSRRTKGARTMNRVPSKYAHLLEFGTRFSEPQPFLSKAIASQRSVVWARFKSRLNDELFAAARKSQGLSRLRLKRGRVK